MAGGVENEQPAFNQYCDRRDLLDDIRRTFSDSAEEVAIGSCQALGMVALLEGDVEPVSIDGEQYYENTSLMLAHVAYPDTRHQFVRVSVTRGGEKRGYAYRLPAPGEMLESLTAIDGIRDNYLSRLLARTTFDRIRAEKTLRGILANPLNLGLIVYSKPPPESRDS